MRTLPIAASFLAVFAAVAAYGCTLDVSGLQPGTTGTSGTPTTSSVGGAGPSSASASSGQMGGAGGVGGASVTTSAATSTGTGCVSTPEVCNDSLDNDCDGRIDCADDECTDPTDGSACVTDAPSGWTLVAFAPGDGAACPSGYTEIAQVQEAPTSADPTCACNCSCPGNVNNPCLHGALSAKIGSGCGAVTLNVNVTGDCDSLGQKFNTNYGTIEAAPLKVKAIDVPGTEVLPDTEPGPGGTTCGPSASAAGGCAGGETCLPKAQAASLCIQHDGDLPCPGGGPSKRRVVGDPNAVNDLRTCAACTCSSNAASCSNATFAGYLDNTCTSTPAPAALAAGTCTSLSGNLGWLDDTHFKYMATANNPTCTPKGAAPNVSGSVEFQAPKTICCP